MGSVLEVNNTNDGRKQENTALLKFSSDIQKGKYHPNSTSLICDYLLFLLP